MNEEQKMYPKRKPAGFNVSHFPIGTVFELNDDIGFETDYTTTPPTRTKFGPFTVRGIVRNGHKNHVLKTGVMQKIGESEHERAYSIAHVKRIISRGTGGTEVEQTWYGIRGPLPRSDVDLMEYTKPDGPIVPRRGYYTTGSLQTLLHYEVSKFAKIGTSVDFERLASAVMSNAWARHVRAGNGLWHLATVINKKRLRKFLRQNLNRYLRNLEAEEKAYYAQQMDDLERDFDSDYDSRDFGSIHAQPLKDDEDAQIETGSHYDNDDPSYDLPADDDRFELPA